jgi:hypothetical protein
VVQENQGLIACRAALAVLSDARGRTVRAVTLYSGVAALLESTRKNLVPVDRMDYERGLATARARLSQSDFAAAWAAGQTLTIEQAIALARHEDA